MKGAQALPATAAFLEAYGIADDIDKISSLANAGDRVTAKVHISHRAHFRTDWPKAIGYEL